ncbi:Pectinesterase inhibitor domain [Macleaya cordata]|uniref:Pectinesterase inhibitor domain n=1 Tax=Macleaya cordata TaxID=56857 RepID=A0A200PR97_MACCD|nr:Pectinesterase inhibitor domain [Macleaya cordata]
MAETIQQTLLLLLIVFISFFHYDQSYAEAEAAAAAPAGTTRLENHRGLTFLERTCRQTQFYNLCISSLQSDTRTYYTADPKGLLRISIDLAKANASHILGYIDNFLDNDKPSSTMTLNITSIESCAEYYDDSVTNLQWAIEAFDGNDGEDYDATNGFIDDAITSTDYCNREIIEDNEVIVEELPEPLTNMNEIMSQLLHISQDILYDQHDEDNNLT